VENTLKQSTIRKYSLGFQLHSIAYRELELKTMQSVLLLRTEAPAYKKAFETAGFQVAFLPVLSKSGSNDWLASNSPASFEGLIVTSAAALEPLLCRACLTP
jgi:hypothetical protein